MAPSKRSRPAFSPPRPGKAKSPTVSTSMSGREAKWKNAKKAAVAKKRVTGSSKNTPKNTSNNGSKRGRKALPTSEDEEDEVESDDNSPSALELVDMGAEKSDADNNGGASNADTAEAEDDTLLSHPPNPNSSPDPDMILAEITHEPAATDSPIPEKLVHRMLVHHFEGREKTKISTDARDLVTKYFEVFVREAIMRSAFEREERDAGVGGGHGYLEVEDLERSSVQLCLDF